jgi:hypothetical protein
MLCIQGKFQPECVPVFITLRDFAEELEKPSLLQHIAQKLSDCGVEDHERKLKALLEQGRV